MDERHRADPVVEMGEWLREEIEAHCGIEAPAPQQEQVEAIADRLNRARVPEATLAPVVLFMAAPAAFICPGRYVYVTRGLVHAVRCSDALAFAIAHEMAHQDLGHLRLASERLGWAGLLPGVLGPAVVLSLAARGLHGPEREAAADTRALDLCRGAGFDGSRCLALFDALEAYALDHGDVDIVFGPDPATAGVGGPVRRGREAVGRWIWERLRGYPSLRDRRAALQAHLQRCPA